MTLDNVIAGKEGDKFWILASQDFRGMEGAEGSDNMRKIEQLAQNIFLSDAGVANTSYDAFLVAKRDIAQYQKAMVKQAAYGVYKALQHEIDHKTFGGQKRNPTGSLKVAFIVSGIDDYGPAMYGLGCDQIGNSDILRIIEPFASIGSGSETAKPTVKRWIQHYGGPDYKLPCDYTQMPMEKGIECLTYAHLEAAEFTPTVSPTFEINAMTADKNGIEVRKIDDLPLEKMRKELEVDKQYFKSKRDSS